MSWQPIETAPRDGTAILVWIRGPWNEIAVARWEGAPSHHWSVRESCFGAKCFTHWMPLPAPPAEGARPMSAEFVPFGTMDDGA